MTAAVTARAEVLREVFRGTGASPPDAGDRATTVESEADIKCLSGGETRAQSAPVQDSGLALLGVIGFAGGAFLLALVALIVASQSFRQTASSREMANSLEAGFADLPRLKNRIEFLAAEFSQERAIRRPAADASQRAAENAQSLQTEVRQAIAAASNSLGRAYETMRAQQAELDGRLLKVETGQAAQAATLQTLQLRIVTLDPPTPTPPEAEKRVLAEFRLRRIKGSVATVEGPDGPEAVSVGDTLSSLGKVLKVERRGRKGVLVAEQGKLTMPWPHASQSRRASNARPRQASPKHDAANDKPL